jgi:hypothetical protein
LVGFGRVGVAAGDHGDVTIPVRSDALAERDPGAHAMVVRPGVYELRVARHAGDSGISAEVSVGRRAAGSDAGHS